MYLKKTPNKKGRISLSAVHGYRDEQGKTRQRTIKTFGFVDELEKEFDDPIAHFSEVVAQMDKERLEQQANQTLEINPRKKVDKRAANRMWLGDSVPLAFYNFLGLEQTVRSYMRTSKARYDCNSILRLLVAERLLNPGSKLSAWENRDSHFFRCDFTQDDVYRSLTELNRMKAPLISKMNTSIAQAGIREESLDCCYYDCTNYYFEADPDEFRVKGVSKEHRPNPIVQMGLLQDAGGIPVTYKLFKGNTNDSQTLLAALPDLKEAANAKRVVVVADKGMNCSSNIITTVGGGDGFVFSQSIRGTKSGNELRDWVLEDRGYAIKADGSFKQKSKVAAKSIHISKELAYDGHAKDVDIDVKYVAFWSKKYAVRARKEREKTLVKSRQLVEHPSRYSRATHYGAASFVKNISFDAKTGEVLEDACDKPELDYDAIEQACACDGYYLIVTSEVNWSDEKIIDTYRELWRIEESFKITKSNLQTRPVYVWTKEHIEAHFLTCYIALVIERLIEYALNDAYGAHAILSALRNLQCSSLEDEWWLVDYRSDLTDELFALIGKESPRKYMRKSDIKTLYRKDLKISWP